MPPGVLVIAGPTASGKTDLAVKLARKFGAEIVGADSRQVYRGMPVGTAAPTCSQMSGVAYHLIGFLQPQERYSAARFSQDATACITAIHARGKRAIVAGGTGFYIRALTGAVDLAPQFDEQLRRRLSQEARIHDGAFLHGWLAVRDPGRAAVLDPGDTYRVVRALEIALAPAATLRNVPVLSLASQGIPFLKVVIEVDDGELRRRIEARTDSMLRGGLLEEAQRIGIDVPAASAVGYPQAIAYLRGFSTREELRTALIRATLRYAKRQQTWFRHEPDAQQVFAADVERAARERLAWV